MDQPTLTMDPTTTPPETRHAARAALYGAAATAFCYPDADSLAPLRDAESRAGIEQAAGHLSLAEQATALLDAAADADPDRLEPAYNDLFGLPGEEGTYPVTPYEAHYTTRDELSIEQRRIATVVGLMEAFGVEPSEEFAERQDHLSAELELAQVMAGQRAVAIEDGEEGAAQRVADAEATLLADHLVEFVPAFAHDVRQATDSPFYLAATEFVEDLVTRDNGRHPEPAVAGGERP